MPDRFDADVAADLTRRIIEEAAEIGDCVIVGRGSQCILQQREDAFHVFIYAPRGERLNRLLRRDPRLSKVEAEKKLDAEDATRAAYVRAHFGEDWQNRHLYHLMLSSSLGKKRRFPLSCRPFTAPALQARPTVRTVDCARPLGSRRRQRIRYSVMKHLFARTQQNGETHPWLIAFTVMLAVFMEVLDTSVANVSLPHIAGNLSAGVDESTWVLTSYLVSNAIVLPLTGWFSSLFGRKRFYMACVAIFTISSMLCGLAPSLPLLVFFRILQGAGGGALQPISQAILLESFPKSKQGMAMAMFGVGVVMAPIIGPTLGGWLTDSYSWRWIFLINIPVGVLSLILTYFLIFDPPFLVRKGSKSGIHIDFIGLGLLSVGLGFLQVVLDKGQREDWFESHFIVVCAVLAVIGLVGALIWELNRKDPIVDFRLLKDRNFLLATMTMFMLGFVLYGSTALLPIFLQTLLGYTALLSGLVLSPGGIIVVIMLPVVGKIADAI